LANRPKSGRSGIADEEYCRILEETLDKSPAELGYASTVWTIKRLRNHLEKEFGRALSESCLRHLMKEKAYRYKRPKHDLHHLQDPEAKEQARVLLEELKKGAAQTISGLSLDPMLRTCSMKIGEQKRIPLPANQEKQHCHTFGAYNWINDQISWMMAERKNSKTFIRFLEHLLIDEYPIGCIVLVLDHASYHKSAAALAALSPFEQQVLVFWLPAHCTELNPTERSRQHLKDLAYANQLWSGLDKLIEAVKTVFHHHNDPSTKADLSFLNFMMTHLEIVLSPLSASVLFKKFHLP
jgi:hypothetical protein